MSASRLLLAAVLICTAAIAQTTMVSALNLPFGRPDLLVVVVVAIALAAGPVAGMSAGFAAGLLADLLSDHPAGLLALVLTLIGYACGLLTEERRRRILTGLAVIAGAAAAAMLGYAGLLAILGSPRLDWRVVAGDLPGSAAYDVILGVVVLPAVLAMFRRLPEARGG